MSEIHGEPHGVFYFMFKYICRLFMNTFGFVIQNKKGEQGYMRMARNTANKCGKYAYILLM